MLQAIKEPQHARVTAYTDASLVMRTLFSFSFSFSFSYYCSLCFAVMCMLCYALLFFLGLLQHFSLADEQMYADINQDRAAAGREALTLYLTID